MNTELFEAQNRLEQLKFEKDTCYEAFKAYAVRTGNLVSENDKLTGKVKALESSVDNYKEKLSLKEKQAQQLAKEKDALAKELETEAENHKKDKENLAMKCAIGLKEANDSLNEAQEEISNLWLREDDLERRIKSQQEKIESLEAEKKKYKAMIGDFARESSSLQGKISDLETDKAALENKICTEKGQLAESDELNNKIEELGKEKESLEAESNKFRANIEELESKIKELERNVEVESNNNKSLVQKVKKLNEEKTALERVKGTKYELKLNKLVNTKLVTVYGASGSGITSVAVSIMRELGKEKKKVCYIDLDLVMPDSDGFIGVDPVLEDGKTGLELCISGKLKKSNIIKFGTNGYIGGVRSKEKGNWTKIDFNFFFKKLDTLGFDYIIVDAGEIGVDDKSSTLISEVCAISDKSIAVFENDLVRYKRFNEVVKEYKIKGMGVVNKCISSKVDKEVLSFSEEMIKIPFEVELYGKRESLSSGSISRARIKDLVKKVM